MLRGHSGLEALGGGSFEEVLRPPLGNCSINTHRVKIHSGQRLNNCIGGQAKGSRTHII
jgi:hypothetical protein